MEIIHEIVKEDVADFTLANHTKANFFAPGCAVVTDIKPLLGVRTFYVANQAREHRMIFVTAGRMQINVNYAEHLLQEGDMLLVPANHIVEVTFTSHDIGANLLAFHFSDVESDNLMGYKATRVSLNASERQAVDEYYSLMLHVLHNPTDGRDDFRHLVLSLLNRLQMLSRTTEGRARAEARPLKSKIVNDFINMVITAEMPERRLDHYAKKLSVSQNYLSVLVKQSTGMTAKEWVDRKMNTTLQRLLMEEKEYTLEELAEHVGFSDASQVVRFFKRLNNDLTPSGFRKMKKETAIAAITAQA